MTRLVGSSRSDKPTPFGVRSCPRRCSAEGEASGVAAPSTRGRAHLLVHLGLPTSPIGAVALTIGSFDGVHLGHLGVIGHVTAAAKDAEAQPALITFEPHPRCVLDPANCPQSITTLQEKLALIEAAGIEHAIVLRFDRELAALSPQEFVDRLATGMELRRWGIGYAFGFGGASRGTASRHSSSTGVSCTARKCAALSQRERWTRRTGCWAVSTRWPDRSRRGRRSGVSSAFS